MNEQQLEQLLNIETTGNQYGFPKLVHYHRYEPTPYSGLQQLFEQYELPKDTHFIDIGCGKGRVPIYIHYQFGVAVTGIEMDEGFYEVAQRNKACYLQKTKKRGKDITFRKMLAEDYLVTLMDNVFFFFNPFSIQIFRKVVQHILHSIEDNSRTVDLILYYPAQEYLQFLLYETNFELLVEVSLQNTKNINERICVFRIS